MPVYEYECGQCGRIQEAFQKISDAPLETCDHCSGRLRKLISQSSFHLKGSGWYVTDYKGNASNQSTSPADAANKDSKPASPAPKESKTADAKPGS